MSWIACLLSVQGSVAFTATEPPTDVNSATLYRAECAGCHGEQGNGKGQADSDLLPPPRDFTRGKFKLRSTDPRAPVSTDELFTSITNGMAGSAMPSFRFLSGDERRQLAQYVRRFAFPDPTESGVPIPVGSPPSATAAMIENGRQQYTNLGCQACHGPEGMGDGPAATALKDEWGNPDRPRNLVSDPYRGGDDEHDIYLRLVAGMPGTPMPGYGEVANEQALWALVAYLRSIRKPSPAPAVDLVERGKSIFDSRHCRACHQLQGKGGQVGPPLDRASERLRSEWLKRFLANPRPVPKLYPIYPQRMPQLYLTPEEIDALVHYLASASS